MRDPYLLLPHLTTRRTRADRERAYLRALDREVSLSTRRRDLVAFVAVTTGSMTVEQVATLFAMTRADVKTLIDRAGALTDGMPRQNSESTGSTGPTD